jgi:hypothetical protein
MKSAQHSALLVFVLCTATVIAAAQDETLPGSVNDVMVNIITPATNTIWGIEDPQTDEEWQVFIDAAAQLIDAATRIKAGGKGPNDSAWAEEAEWQRYADVLIDSGAEIQAAARERDLDTLINVSNDKMYPPCEECHVMFHPDMQQQDNN